MKRMGVRPGVHDYHLPIARGIYHSLWVELKPDVKNYRPRISSAQIEWRKMMIEEGSAAYIVKGWPLAIAIMKIYCSLKDGESIREIVRDRKTLYDECEYDCGE